MSADFQTQNSGTRPIAPQHRFDTARLLDWLRGRVEGIGTSLEVEQFNGGQSNPTFRLTSGERRFVLRRKPAGVLLPSAHAIEREYRVISALAGTDVPVARAHVLCEDSEVIGSPFYLMDFVEGRVLWDPTLPGLEPAQRHALYDELNRVIAALHRVDPAAVGLSDYGKPGDYIKRQVERWTRQYRAAETETIDAVERLIEWLPRHLPPGDSDSSGTRIVHGDYRIDNVIFDRVEPRIIAVLDWELSTLGDPLSDFAYHCMVWRMDTGAARGMAGVDVQALGIPTESAYLDRYLQRVHAGNGEMGGRLTDAQWTFYLVFNMFRLVGILQGIMARALQGNASNERAVEAGRRARPLAERAWALVEQMDRLG